MTSAHAHGADRRPAARRDHRREPAPHRRAVRRPRGARRPPPGLPRDLRASSGSRSTARRARCSPAACSKGDRVGIWSPNRYEWVVLQYATARIGAILVNINPAYKAAELEYALRPVRRQRARAWPAASGRRDYVAMLAEVRGRCPALRDALVLDDDWDDVPGRRRARRATRSSPSARRRCSSTTRSTSSTRRARPASPRARRSRTTTSSTTRYFIGERCATPSATASASRCRSTTASAWCSATSPAPPTARASSCPARRSTPLAVLETVAGRALHLALRRADDVHRRARPPALRRASTCRRCAPASWPARRARSR